MKMRDEAVEHSEQRRLTGARSAGEQCDPIGEVEVDAVEGRITGVRVPVAEAGQRDPRSGGHRRHTSSGIASATQHTTPATSRFGKVRSGNGYQSVIAPAMRSATKAAAATGATTATTTSPPRQTCL